MRYSDVFFLLFILLVLLGGGFYVLSNLDFSSSVDSSDFYTKPVFHCVSDGNGFAYDCFNSR
jgi:hypothetical protein